jgi:hypothetical protein
MPNSVEKAQKWIDLLVNQALPSHDAFIQQVAIGHVTEVCQCGCNGFDFYVPDEHSMQALRAGAGLFCELAFESDLAEEIDILLFADTRGLLCRVDVTYGATNVDAVPDNIQLGKLKGIWPTPVGVDATG